MATFQLEELGRRALRRGRMTDGLARFCNEWGYYMRHWSEPDTFPRQEIDSARWGSPLDAA